MPKAPRTRYQSLSPPPSTNARKLYLCQSDGCSYSTVNSGDLKRHMKQHLSAEERANHMYKCPFCDYQELQRHNVEVHIAKHKGIKPFACPDCEKRYSDPATVTRHKKAKHDYQPHHTARYYLAREQDASKPPPQKPQGKKKRSSSRRAPTSDVPAWSALHDDDFAAPRSLIEPLPSFKDLHLGEASLDVEMHEDDRGSRRSLFTQSADGRFRLPELPPMRPRPLTSMYRSPSSSSSLGLGRLSSSPSVSPVPAHLEYSHQWPRASRAISPLSYHADDDYYYRSPSASSFSDSAYNDQRGQSSRSLSPSLRASSSTLSDRSTEQNYHFVGRDMFKSGRGSSESEDEEEIDELEAEDEEFVPYRRVKFNKPNCPSKGRTSNGPMVRY